MRRAFLLLLGLAFLGGCGASQKYPGVETKPREPILKSDY
jgi:hypothetical protein